MHTPPEVIFFDAVGTLIFLPRTVGEHYRDVALDFGIAPDAGRLDRAFKQAWKASPPRRAAEGPRPEDDKGWWRDLVETVTTAVLTENELRGFDQEAYFERLYAHFAKPGVWELYPEVIGVLGKLQKQGLRLGVISNFDQRLRAVFDHLGVASIFEHVIISSEVGVDKPAPLIFMRALKAFGVEPAQAIHVGDDLEKDVGAEAVGLRVFHLKRPQRTLSDLTTYLERNDGTQEENLHKPRNGF